MQQHFSKPKDIKSALKIITAETNLCSVSANEHGAYKIFIAAARLWGNCNIYFTIDVLSEHMEVGLSRMTYSDVLQKEIYVLRHM